MARILLVEDDPSVARLLHRALSAFGHDVTQAADGREALLKWDEARPDVVVTDIHMPGMDGLELIHALHHRAPEVRIVAISGGGSRGTMLHLATAEKFGAQKVLAKPFSTSELVAAVDSVLRDQNRPSPDPV